MGDQLGGWVVQILAEVAAASKRLMSDGQQQAAAAAAAAAEIKMKKTQILGGSKEPNRWRAASD